MRPLTVAVAKHLVPYEGLVALVPPGRGIEFVPMWLSERAIDRAAPDVIVVSDDYATRIRVRATDTQVARLFQALAEGRLGYQLAMSVGTSYFTSGLYTALDPRFRFVMGEAGFLVYERDPSPRTRDSLGE